ncbi:MAG: hypothetical protein A2381_03030 [Bdellovibrionales bacterium RIFOXYB1_FULL_37_110]|nr:MAG: hypothetical protein A2181_03410 [Bdellovibrionales bacterium RIFOXYA1_FULL_38_20]OFZ51480.1 MAG: hypothetical protein A2417_09485 [Bdellovibrionales bacterium RIFOXYC1_FULL_37_79]OFZ57908.1 MAG: hypothetical protein A2381_03030 [Bdellovibrionales bacterium RIFOXYB1_FULL_37_110]OFZ63634.1 MAG: hypothetical protein A2577_05330 [Bdellovibrionales bacterium RIFOXYD1_FULL_36_51]
MKIVLLGLVLVMVFFPIKLSANDVYVVVMQKQEQKKQRGWSLADWMVTKNKMKIMDMWLALNSSANLFEFYLGGHQNNYDLNNRNTATKEAKKSLGGELGAYISILGIELEYDKSNEKYDLRSGMIGLRILGTAYQGTNLTIGFGNKTFDVENDNEYNNQFVQGKLAINLFSFLGVQGIYKNYLARKSNGIELSGYKNMYGAYLDIYFLRLYGNLFNEKLNYSNSLTYTTQKRSGYTLGAQIFF